MYVGANVCVGANVGVVCAWVHICNGKRYERFRHMIGGKSTTVLPCAHGPSVQATQGYTHTIAASENVKTLAVAAVSGMVNAKRHVGHLTPCHRVWGQPVSTRVNVRG